MVKNKDRWSALSMKERADLINMYITNGIRELTEMKKHYNGIPYRDLNTSDYDYFNASPEMIPTEEGQHWDSRNTHTGRLLKGENHPTFDLMVEGENKAGYKIVRGYNGELYSIPNTPDNYVENYNSFGDGGPTREMTPSEAKAINKTLNKSQYMLAVGDSPDDPAYLSTDGLQPAVVIAEAKKPTNEEIEQNKRNFAKQIRDRSLVGYIGDGISTTLGDTSLLDIASTAIGLPLLMTNPVGQALLNTTLKTYNTPGIKQAADTYFTYEGLKNLTGDNGVKKTVDLFKNKEYAKGVKSAIGDAMDAAGPIFLMDDLYKFGREGVRLGKWMTRSANDVLNINTSEDALNAAVNNYRKYINSAADISDYDVRFVENLPKDTWGGVYFPDTKRINIKTKANKVDEMMALMHEMRHQDDPFVHKNKRMFTLNSSSRPTGRLQLDSGQTELLNTAYGDVKNTLERITSNTDLRSILELQYIKETGKIPTVNQLDTYIEKLSPFALNIAKAGANGYTANAIFPSLFNTDYVKDALMFVRKDGGNINRFDIGGNTTTHNKTKEQIAIELQSKNRNELLSLQQTLANAGYYDQTLQLGKNDSAFGLQDFLIGKGLLTTNDRDGSVGENTIKALQTFLVNEKYLPRHTETGYDNIDGKLGNTTQNAYNAYLRKSNVDGFYGDKTLNAYYDYLNQNNASVQPINNFNLSKDEFFKYIKTPIRQQTWQSKGFKGWTDEDLLYLYNQLPATGWDPKALMYAIDRETNFMPYAKSPISSAIGLAQLTKDQLKQLYRESYRNLSEEELLNRVNRVYNSYKNKTRSVRDIIDDTILQYSWMRNRIKTEPENMGYGRIKVNLLAPNARLDDVVPKYVYEGSLTKDQQSKIKLGKATYRDLMMMYDEEFKNKFNL